jgi:succinoglycan biosynthesis protein ExoL
VYVAPDCTDSAVRKRALGFLELGHDVTSFSFRRHRYNAGYQAEWKNVELGTSEERQLGARVVGLLKAILTIVRHRSIWRNATVIYARNLDLALLTLVAIFLTRSRAPLVYEILDIHPLLTRAGFVGATFRWLERRILRRAALLVVSSEAYLREYFRPSQGYQGRSFVLENKWPRMLLPAKIDPQTEPLRKSESVWTIGWFGNIRCKESLRILLEVADALPDRVRIYLRGYASLLGPQILDQAIGGRSNVVFAGEYVAPEDLAEIYSQIDLNWCGDFSDGDNSLWLLPNRLYEGGYYGVPAIGIAEHETGKTVVDRQWGVAISAPHAANLIDWLSQLTPDSYREMRRHIESQTMGNFADIDDMQPLFESLEAR